MVSLKQSPSSIVSTSEGKWDYKKSSVGNQSKDGVMWERETERERERDMKEEDSCTYNI